MSRTPRALFLTPALVTLVAAATACADSGQPSAPPPAEGRPPVVSSGPPATADPEDDFLSTTRDLRRRAASASTPPAVPAVPPNGDAELAADVRALWLRPSPSGTGPEIALRFLQALQRGQHLAAARELQARSRLTFSAADPLRMVPVLDDVAVNAGLSRSGACSSAQAIDRESAAVRCGDVVVVVHVEADDSARGVLLSEEHPPTDRYSGPHTHAFTSLRP